MPDGTVIAFPGGPVSGGFSRLHRAALDYAAAGFPVFPCWPNDKRPMVEGGFHQATTDPHQIDDWWGHWPDANIGFPPARKGCSVVDLDPKDGGPETWARFEEERPDTLTIGTPSGGVHLHYTGVTGSSVRKLGRGIDTRGVGGYVLLPPSVIDGREYTVLHDRPAAPLPLWIAARMTVEREALPVPDSLTEDAPHAVEQARTELKRLVSIGHVPREGNRDNLCYQVAARLRGLGLSQDMTFRLTYEWAAHGELPGEDHPLSAIIASAYRGGHPGQNPQGSELEPPDEERYHAVLTTHADAGSGPPPSPPRRSLFRTWPEIEAFVEPKTEFVLRDLIVKNRANLLTGKEGAGKTVCAANIAVAVGAGLPLLGKQTMVMNVVLLVTEDKYLDMRRYIESIAAARGVGRDVLVERIQMWSTLSEPRADGHVLAHIDDGGEIKGTAAGADLMEDLAAMRGPVLLILDPIEELFRFNRLEDRSARGLIRGFGEGHLRQAGDITALFTDHPSRSAERSKEDYAGTRQLVAATASFFALAHADDNEEWIGTAPRRQQKMRLRAHRTKYAVRQDFDYYRTTVNFALGLEPLWEFNERRTVWRAYSWIRARIEEYKEGVRSTYTPLIASELELPEKDVKTAIERLIIDGHIKKSGTLIELGIPLVMAEAYS
ncbi:MAG: bifunctional DNA primase/polymerase [Methylocella sp.]